MIKNVLLYQMNKAVHLDFNIRLESTKIFFYIVTCDITIYLTILDHNDIVLYMKKDTQNSQ